MSIMVALFNTRDSAVQAVDQLLDNTFIQRDITLRTRPKEIGSTPSKQELIAVTLVGVLAGALIGALIGLLIGLSEGPPGNGLGIIIAGSLIGSILGGVGLSLLARSNRWRPATIDNVSTNQWDSYLVTARITTFVQSAKAEEIFTDNGAVQIDTIRGEGWDNSDWYHFSEIIEYANEKAAEHHFLDPSPDSSF